MKITQKLLNELCFFLQSIDNPKKLVGKEAIIFRTAKGLKDAIYTESYKNKDLVEMVYSDKIKKAVKEFLNDYWNEWKKDTGSWGLKSKDTSFYQWFDYSGQLHEFVSCEISSFDNDEILEHSENGEDDYGLWDRSKEWWEIKDTMAFYTLRNDLSIAILEEAKNLAIKENIDSEKID